MGKFPITFVKNVKVKKHTYQNHIKLISEIDLVIQYSMQTDGIMNEKINYEIKVLIYKLNSYLSQISLFIFFSISVVKLLIE